MGQASLISTHKNADYLTGRDESFLVEFNHHLLHPQAAKAFEQLQKDAKKAGIQLAILSSFRSFERQLSIWERKLRGELPIYNENSKAIDQSASIEEKISGILKWSAIPGCSRHHWGTDIDVFDANKIAAKEVKLIPAEAMPGGPSYELDQWLEYQIKINQSYGFFRPYSDDIGGVAPEHWHLSYAPISSKNLSEYSLDLFLENIKTLPEHIQTVLQNDSSQIFQKYIHRITPPPFRV